MDVIKITPDELRTLASAAETEAEFNDMRKQWERWHGPEGYDLEQKLLQLAAKLEHDGREALEFIPAKGVPGVSVLRGIAEELPGLGVMVDSLEADPGSEYRAALCYGFIIALFAAKIITHEINTAAMLEIEKIQDSVYEGVQS